MADALAEAEVSVLDTTCVDVRDERRSKGASESVATEDDDDDAGLLGKLDDEGTGLDVLL